MGRSREPSAIVPRGHLLRLLLGLALAACAAGCGQGGGEPAPQGGEPTRQSLPPLGSEPLLPRTPEAFEADLAGLRGRVVVVNFWATWCEPCRREMPALERLARELAHRPVTVVGVDTSDDRERALRFLNDLKITYPTVFDAKGIRGGIASEWSVTGLPQTWLIDRQGSRSGRIAGEVSGPQLRQRVMELLAG